MSASEISTTFGWPRVKDQVSPCRRADIDITELRECIGNLLMLQVEDGGCDFRYLVHGTQVARDYGQDQMGKRITDILNDSSETLLAFYRAVYRERRLYFSRMNANLISFVDMIERFMLR